MKPEFSQKIFEKYSKTKFHEIPSSGNRAVPCGQTDGRKETTKTKSRFSQFCEKRLQTIRRHSLSCGQQTVSAQTRTENCSYSTVLCISNESVSSFYMTVRRDYKLEGPGFNSCRGKVFFIPQNPSSDPGACSVSRSRGTVRVILVAKRPPCEVTLQLPHKEGVMNEWSCTSTSIYTFTARKTTNTLKVHSVQISTTAFIIRMDVYRGVS